MTRASTSLLALAATMLLLAACGGSSEPTKEEYGQALRATMANLDEAYGDANVASTDGAEQDTAATVRQLKASQLSLRDAGNQLDDVTPPSRFAKDHEQIVEGVREMADAIDLLVEAQELAESDPKAAEAAARKFSTDDSFEQVALAAANLEEAGVDTGL